MRKKIAATLLLVAAAVASVCGDGPEGQGNIKVGPVDPNDAPMMPYEGGPQLLPDEIGPARSAETRVEVESADCEKFLARALKEFPRHPRKADPDNFAKLSQLEQVVLLARWSKARKKWLADLADRQTPPLRLIFPSPGKPKADGKLSIELHRVVRTPDRAPQPVVLRLKATGTSAKSLLQAAGRHVEAIAQLRRASVKLLPAERFANAADDSNSQITDWQPAAKPATRPADQKKATIRPAKQAAREALVLDMDISRVELVRSKVDKAKFHGGRPAAGAKGAVVQFFGEKQSADDVIFLIDKNGSMAQDGWLDRAARETLISIARLGPKQRFHLILLDEGSCIQAPARRLVKAVDKNKVEAVELLEKVRGGATELLPALKEAYRHMAGSGKRRQVIFVVTNGRLIDRLEDLVKMMGKMDPKKQVIVNTVFLNAHDDKKTVQQLKGIAEAGGGKLIEVKADA
ncbi:MAG: vWA domain-containing protein [Phycisphaerae bacterium]